jgi:D-ribulokinase
VVVAGMTDGCAGQLAAGALRAGGWNSVLGTTLVLKGVTERRVTDPGGGAYSHRAPDGRWWLGGASGAGAGALAHAFPGADLAEMDAAAELDRPASCVSYPLVGRGERFPFVAPEAEGFTVGRPAGELDRYAALLQGVAYLERLCVDHLGMLGAPVREPVRVTGGAVRSAAWTQLRADVLDRRMEVPAVTDPAFGMAVLAAGSTAGAEGIEAGGIEVAAERMVHVARVFRPRPAVGARLAEGYHRLAAALRDRGWLPESLAAVAGAA